MGSFPVFRPTPPVVRSLPEPPFLSSQVAASSRRFYLGTPARPTGPILVVSGGSEQCRADYEIDRTDFPYWVVEFVVAGAGTLELSGRSHVLRPGVAFAYGPLVPHRIWTHPESPMLKYFAVLTGSALETLVRSTPLCDNVPVRVSAVDEIVEVYEMMIRAARRHTPWSARLASSLVPVLFLKLAETAIPPGSENSAAFSTYLRIRRLMVEHYRELRSVSQVADAAQVSPSYLCRLFQRYDQQSAHQLLIRLKMNQAVDLLMDQHRTVKEVAEALGYPDPFQFSRIFRKIHGLSPAHFRRESP